MAVVMAQTPLRNSNRVVLQTDFAVIVEQGNAGGIMRAVIVGLFRKQHVISADCVRAGVWIELRCFVPKAQMAVTGAKVCTKNPLIVMESLFQEHLRMESGIRFEL